MKIFKYVDQNAHKIFESGNLKVSTVLEFNDPFELRGQEMDSLDRKAFRSEIKNNTARSEFYKKLVDSGLWNRSKNKFLRDLDLRPEYYRELFNHNL